MIGNVLDIFRSDAYSQAAMIARADSMQFVPYQASSLGIWTPESVAMEIAFIERRDQILTLVNPSEHGDDGQQINDGKRDIKAVKVPHFQQNDRIYVHQVANVREYGSTNAFQTVESVVNRRMQIAEVNFAGTEEFLAMGALQGVIKAPNGNTILDLYGLFNVTKEVAANYTFHITAGNAAGAAGDGTLKNNCLKIVRKIRDNLRMGSVLPQVFCLAGPAFMDKLTSSNELRTNYARYYDQASLGQVGAFLRDGQLFGKPPFPYGEIFFEEYRGPANFLAATDAIFFPIPPPGTPLYPWIYAPATEYPDTVNTLGRPRYARVAIDPLHGKWVDIEESVNPLPICMRPTALITTSFD